MRNRMKDAKGQELQPGDLVIHANWSDTIGNRIKQPARVSLALFEVVDFGIGNRQVLTKVIWGNRHESHSGNHSQEYLYKFPKHLEPTRENVIAYRRLIGLEP